MTSMQRRRTRELVNRTMGALLVSAFFLGACQANCGADRRFDAIVYGNDDRIEISAAEGDARTAGRSVATLVSAEKEMLCRGDGCTFATTILNEGFRNRLCTDEPFRDQPTLGGCTAFLVAPKLMATAGHCVRTADECRDTIVVFDFDLPRAKDKPFTLEKAAIYRCAKVHQGLVEGGRGPRGFAIERTKGLVGMRFSD